MTAVLQVPEAGTHLADVREVMEMVLRDLKDHLTLGSLPSSERYWKIQIVATRIIMISKTSRNALSVSSSWYTDSDIASQRFAHYQERRGMA